MRCSLKNASTNSLERLHDSQKRELISDWTRETHSEREVPCHQKDGILELEGVIQVVVVDDDS